MTKSMSKTHGSNEQQPDKESSARKVDGVQDTRFPPFLNTILLGSIVVWIFPLGSAILSKDLGLFLSHLLTDLPLIILSAYAITTALFKSSLFISSIRQYFVASFSLVTLFAMSTDDPAYILVSLIVILPWVLYIEFSKKVKTLFFQEPREFSWLSFVVLVLSIIWWTTLFIFENMLE